VPRKGNCKGCEGKRPEVPRLKRRENRTERNTPGVWFPGGAFLKFKISNHWGGKDQSGGGGKRLCLP